MAAPAIIPAGVLALARPSYGLAIPRLDAGIPRSITVSGREGSKSERTARIAEALLAEGILRERDWCGNLAKSMDAGLSRWLNTEMGGEHWDLFSALKVVYTDDMEDSTQLGMDADGWRNSFAGAEEEPVGFFSLVWTRQECQGVQVRRQVLALEKAFPGFGFGLMYLLDAASAESVMVHSFHWGASLVENWEEGWEEWGDDHPEDEGRSTLLSMKRFNSIVPEGAHSTSWVKAVAQDALAQTRRNNRKSRFGRIVRLALRLDELLYDSSGRFEHADHLHLFESDYSCSEATHHPTVYTYWLNDEEDPMHRVVDQYYQDEMSTGSLTDFSWFHGFQIGNPGTARARNSYVSDSLRKTVEGRELDGSLRSTIHALRSAVQITGVLEQIFAWLDESRLPPEEEPKPRARRGRKLTEIFAKARAEETDEPCILTNL